MNNFQNPMYPQNFVPQPQNFYGNMPPGINWQQEMTNRLNNLQNQIQNSFTNQNVQNNNINQGFLKGRIVGSKEEVLSAQVDFNEPQFFPVGNEYIYVKRLGLDGKSQVLEYKLNIEEKPKTEEQVNFSSEFDLLKSNYSELLSKYNQVYNDLINIKNELGIKEE